MQIYKLGICQEYSVKHLSQRLQPWLQHVPFNIATCSQNELNTLSGQMAHILARLTADASPKYLAQNQDGDVFQSCLFVRNSCFKQFSQVP